MPPVASTTICEKPMTISMASDRPSTNRLKLDKNPGDFEREQRAEQNEDDDQAGLLTQHKGSAARLINDLIGHGGRCSFEAAGA